MRYRARIEVSLKPGHSDPEGETTAKSLRELRYPVETVNVSKVYEVYLRANSLKEAEKQADEMCRRLLANPTKDNYRFDVEEVK
ncbi:phosphoribosylformylglycinamidine synthase subunit PurS [Candidatus Bathyarchaeota archaeon]|nr:phosphoribosylformylglycinamidine synthase subunit PurS [Candidatus Bathyarchaeota archaeon]